MSFVNLHGHSHYSLLDGYGSPKKIVERAKALGYPGVALTDHGVTYGLIELYQAAKAEGIKPILGCELYVANRTRFDKEARVDVKPYHLTVIAETNEGYENLLSMVTKAHVEGFYYKPRVDMELLEKHSNGLIVLSGCISAQLPRAILAENGGEVHRLISEFIRIFGKDNYFLEMQDHPLLEQQTIVNDRVKSLAKEYGLGLVVTCDSHYPKPEDSDAHDILLCIQTGSTVGEEGRMRYTGDFSLRDPKELGSVFADCPEALSNTVKIADRCCVEFDFSKNLIPSFDTPDNMSADDYLRKLCLEGLEVRFNGAEIPADYMDRLNYELNTVHEMGFDTYFLIVHDFVKYAREIDIVVGPGRGSAAGSILAWSLKITDLDPIKYGLFFERFLNPERVSMPDIDIDFADNRRDEVLNYVIKKYGRDNVAQIITFGTMAPRAAVRDVGRALGYPYAEVDQLAKIVPPPVLGKHIPLKVSIEDDPSLREAYKNNERARTLLDYAKQLEGTVRHAGTHACAVVISEEPLSKYTACQFGARGDEIVTQYSMKPLEDLGLLKMDFLGLKNLTVIEETERLVKLIHDETVDVTKVPLDDEITFKLLQRADTTGVFQLESGGMRRYLKQLKPTEFDDIVAMGALYRPGPMEWIPDYIRGKHNPKKVKYLHPSFKAILEKTHGVAVYQEQILQLARDFAGFTVGEADLLRKAVGKKIPSLLAEQQVQFVQGAVKNGHPEKFAKEVFEKVVEPFAGYGFNKAHAVCYGLIAYQTAYLKARYPVEFMTALLCSDANNTDRVVLEIKECIEMGIDVLPPSVNESYSNFTVVDQKKIRFGLLAIKGVGEGPIKALINARKLGGPFTSLEDFAKRTPVEVLNKKVIQALAYSGALDEFGDRNQIAENYDEVVKFAKYFQGLASTGQGDLFGSLDDDSSGSGFALELRVVAKSTNMQRLKWEKEFLGMFVSGHPLRGLRSYISRKGQLIVDLNKKKVGKNVQVLGTLSGMRKILTKSGGYMATFMLEDPSAKVSAVMFPKTYANFGASLTEDSVFGFNGKLDYRQGQFQIICDSAKVLSVDVMVENAKEAGLFNPDDKSDIGIRLIDDILDEESESDDEIVDESTAGDMAHVDGVEETSVVAVDDEKLFLIEISSGVGASKMQGLKELLIENKGETKVELYLKDARKRIKLPFGIKLTKDLEKAINSLLV